MAYARGFIGHTAPDADVKDIVLFPIFVQPMTHAGDEYTSGTDRIRLVASAETRNKKNLAAAHDMLKNVA